MTVLILHREETMTLLKYLKATAFAEEYQWWPPPVFILTLTLSQLVFFAIHAAHLVQAGVAQSEFFGAA